MSTEKVVFSKPAIIAAIAYTNLLHINAGEPSKVRRDDPELWNQQMVHAEQLLAWMITDGFLG